MASSIYSRAKPRIAFCIELGDWLSTTVYDQIAEPVVAAGGGEIRNAIERLRAAVSEASGSKQASAAMSDLAKAVQAGREICQQDRQSLRCVSSGGRGHVHHSNIDELFL